MKPLTLEAGQLWVHMFPCDDHFFIFISIPQFKYDLFHISLTLISFTGHMNPQLTCSQRQWLHSSAGRASHRYREVTGSNPVEVLIFSGFFMQLHKLRSLRRSFLHFQNFNCKKQGGALNGSRVPFPQLLLLLFLFFFIILVIKIFLNFISSIVCLLFKKKNSGS